MKRFLPLLFVLVGCNPMLYPDPECSKTDLKADLVTRLGKLPSGTQVANCKCQTYSHHTIWNDDSKTSGTILLLCNGKFLPHVIYTDKVVP